MTRIRDLASILTASSSMATDTEVSAVSAQIPANVAGKNFLINGLFDFWQRTTDVTSSAVSGTFYAAADRWQTWNGVAVSTRYQRIADGDPGVSQYSYRIQRVSGSTTATNYQIIQNIETSTSKLLVGKTMTLSFRVKKGANFSPTSGTMNAKVQYNNNTDGNAINQLTSTAFTGTFSPTTSFATYSLTGTIPSSGVSSVMVNLTWEPTGTAGADDWLEISAVQLEVGSVATPFSRAGGTLQGELAACQRYYQIAGDTIYEIMDGGYMATGNVTYKSWIYAVPMRTTPTGTVVGSWAISGIGQPTLQATQQRGFTLRATSSTTGAYYFHSNTAYYLTFSAEF
jgi:hypothetical protein